jgi:hypothetical protein
MRCLTESGQGMMTERFCFTLFHTTSMNAMIPAVLLSGGEKLGCPKFWAQWSKSKTGIWHRRGKGKLLYKCVRHCSKFFETVLMTWKMPTGMVWVSLIRFQPLHRELYFEQHQDCTRSCEEGGSPQEPISHQQELQANGRVSQREGLVCR